MTATNWTQYPIGHGYITSSIGGDTPHYAADVETPFHTPITALWSGTVKQADYAVWGGQPGGGEVFIQPDSGGDEYYYYHLDELDTRAGQHVSAGQTIGLSGGQNSGGEHPVAPAWSSGPHTHVGYFEKFVNTPIGSRPYGPDITPALTSGALSGLGTGSVQPLASLTTPEGLAASTTSNPLGLPSASQLANVGYRVLFIVLGLLFLYLGLKHFMDLPGLPSGGDTSALQGETAKAAKGAGD